MAVDTPGSERAAYASPRGLAISSGRPGKCDAYAEFVFAALDDVAQRCRYKP